MLTALHALLQVKDTIQFATPGRVAGFIHETIQGVGGSVQLADGFLSEAYQVLRVLAHRLLSCLFSGRRCRDWLTVVIYTEKEPYRRSASLKGEKLEGHLCPTDGDGRWRPEHRGRGADGLRTHRQPLLGLPDPGAL